MHAGRHKQDGPDVPVEVDPKKILLEQSLGCIFIAERLWGSFRISKISCGFYLQIFTSFCTSRDIVRYKVRWQLNLGDQTIHNFFRDLKKYSSKSDQNFGLLKISRENIWIAILRVTVMLRLYLLFASSIF